jgi:glycosyltransferase involved in cell wall biosynthesis
LEVQDGEHLLIADTPDSFANACQRVLQDKELAQRLAQNARQRILECYDAKVGLRPLDLAYEQARRC